MRRLHIQAGQRKAGTMSHLGSFGAAVRELDPDERDTFDFFGETFTIHQVVPPILYWQFGAAIAGEAGSTAFRAAMWNALAIALTKPAEGDEPEDDSQFDQFYLLAIGRKASYQSLADLAMKLFEVAAGRPTEEPSGSSPGQQSTLPNSNTSSSTPPALPGMTRVADALTG